MKKFLVIAVAALLCNATGSAWAAGEAILHFTDSVTPLWQEGSGVFLELSGIFVQTEPGYASATIRLLGEGSGSPLSFVYDSAEGGGWAVAGQDDLLHDWAQNTTPANEKTVAWRIQLRRLQQPAQKIVVSELRNGVWETVLSQDIALKVKNLREWVETHQSVVTFGIAGPLVLAQESLRLRMLRASTLVLIR